MRLDATRGDTCPEEPAVLISHQIKATLKQHMQAQSERLAVGVDETLAVGDLEEAC